MMDDKCECSKCKSGNWRCWDERVEWFFDPAETDTENQYFEFPVGYLVCKDCGNAWLDYPDFGDDVQHIGSTHQLNQIWYGYDYDG